MMKEVIRAMETGVLAEIGLISFIVAFVLIVLKVAVMKPSARIEAKQLPLEEAEEISVPSPNE